MTATWDLAFRRGLEKGRSEAGAHRSHLPRLTAIYPAEPTPSGSWTRATSRHSKPRKDHSLRASRPSATRRAIPLAAKESSRPGEQEMAVERSAAGDYGRAACEMRPPAASAATCLTCALSRTAKPQKQTWCCAKTRATISCADDGLSSRNAYDCAEHATISGAEDELIDRRRSKS